MKKMAAEAAIKGAARHRNTQRCTERRTGLRAEKRTENTSEKRTRNRHPGGKASAPVTVTVAFGWGEVKGNMRVFDPNLPNPAANNALGAMWYGSTHARGRTTLQAPVYNTFLPRFGFAWQFNPKSTLRGGFGLYAYNWSLDTYAGGMGSAFGTQGNQSDQTNGVAPVVILSSPGTQLPYIPASTDPGAFNNQQLHQPAPPRANRDA